MKYLKKLGISIGIFSISFLSLLLITTLFSYLNIIKSNMATIITIIIPLLSIFLSSLYIGKNSIKKGWLEGIKLGLIIIVSFITINLLFYNKFNIRNLIYYLILLLSSVLGSMLGINKKKV